MKNQTPEAKFCVRVAEDFTRSLKSQIQINLKHWQDLIEKKAIPKSFPTIQKALEMSPFCRTSLSKGMLHIRHYNLDGTLGVSFKVRRDHDRLYVNSQQFARMKLCTVPHDLIFKKSHLKAMHLIGKEIHIQCKGDMFTQLLTLEVKYT
jgi:hypothetical protein